MVELRKRKASETESAPLKKVISVKSTSNGQKGVPVIDDAVTSQQPVSNTVIDLMGFGGEIEDQEGAKTTLKQLDLVKPYTCNVLQTIATPYQATGIRTKETGRTVDDSKNGVVLFTYPKASTPGCTTQACLFRDEFASLTSTGFSIYGLSSDSPKSNKNFKTKQSLPYMLLCDPAATLIKAIGMKKKPSGTIRGVFVVGKDGKIYAATQGGPAATVEIVRKLVNDKAGLVEDTATLAQDKEVQKNDVRALASVQNSEEQSANGDQAKAEVAAEVADTVEVIDEDTAA